jgi:enhancing lycopene biosynthesis protein 2
MQVMGVFLCSSDFSNGTEFSDAFLTVLSVKKQAGSALLIVADQSELIVIKDLINKCNVSFTANEKKSSYFDDYEIISLKESVPEQLSGLIFSGGFGVISQLTTFEKDGSDYIIDEQLFTLVDAIHKQHKPIGFVSQSSLLVPKLFDTSIRVTLGNNTDRAELLDAIGAEPVFCPADDIVVNMEMRIVSTPGGLSEDSDTQAALGIDKLVRCVMEWSE